MRPRRASWAIACAIVVVTVIGSSAVATPLSASTLPSAQNPKPPSEFHGWRIETFGPVAVVVASDDDVQLSSTSAPGGMFFRRTLTAGASYRLTIIGHVRSGQTTVRLTLGQSQPQWFPAPDGQKIMTFIASASVEVVVYSDTPYEYRLQDLVLEPCDDCARPAVFTGWQVEPYGAVESTSKASSLVLASPGNPGGLFFRKAIDPDKTYRLRIAGKALSGGTTVRLTVGRADPKWFPAPDGTKHVTVSGSESIEVVVYGDAAYAYHLETLAMDECVACLTDRQLASQILAEIPALQNELEHDRKDAARALLNWTANIVDLGLGDVGETTSQENEMGAAEAYQELWADDRGGTTCAGFADFFAKVLSLFGLEAFTMNVGYQGTPLTHVTTVAVIDGEFYLLDPTFNGAYVDRKSGGLLRLRELLATSQPRSRDYAFRTNPITRDVVFTADTDRTVLRQLSVAGVKMSGCEPAPDAATGAVRHICRNVPYDARFLQEEWKDELTRLHLDWNDDLILNLMRHRVLSLSVTNQAIKQQFLDALTAYGIPVGPL